MVKQAIPRLNESRWWMPIFHNPVDVVGNPDGVEYVDTVVTVDAMGNWLDPAAVALATVSPGTDIGTSMRSARMSELHAASNGPRQRRIAIPESAECLNRAHPNRCPSS
mmetsp:Transcript_31261/g.60385  ORF Transcript_31261/g.60385 Transcript_31261/m.60385 type:complete len:109 (+) Transcript_31261:657-983(+)